MSSAYARILGKSILGEVVFSGLMEAGVVEQVFERCSTQRSIGHLF